MATPPDANPLPADVVGLRPAGGRPQGAAGLALAAARALRSHFGRLLFITVVTLATLLRAMSLLAGLIGQFGGLVKGEGRTPDLLSPLSWIVVVPLMVGFVYAVLLLLQGQPPRVAAIFHAFESGSQYLNVLAAGAVPAAIQWILEMQTRPVLESAGWLPAAADVSFRAALVRQLPGAIFSVMVLPLAFAAIHVLVTRAPFVVALGRSLNFFRRNPGLAVGYAALSLSLAVGICAVVSVINTQAQRLGVDSWTEMKGPEVALNVTVYAAAVFTVVLVTLIGAVLSALFYREFLWRDREAAGLTSGLVP